VDLGSLSWAKSSTYANCFYATMPNPSYKFASDVKAICSKYTYVGTGTNMSILTSKEEGIALYYTSSSSNTREVYIKDSSCNTVADLTQAINGVKLAFEPTDTYTGNRAIVVSECGKNLWDEQWELGGILWANGNKYNATDRLRSKDYIPLKPNTTYHITKTNNIDVCFYDANKNFVESNASITSVFTTKPNVAYMLFSEFQATTYNHDIAIIEGTSGSYIPHESNTVFIPITQPMCSVNDVADELVKVGGKWKEHRRFKTIVIDKNKFSASSWKKSTSYPGGYYISDWVRNNSIPQSINHIQDNFATANSISEYVVGTVFFDYSLNIRVDNALYPTVNDFLNYLDTNPITMVYEVPDTYRDCIDQVPFYELVSYTDKTYVSTNEGLAVLNIAYGDSEISATVLANYNTSNRAEAKLDKLLNPSALAVEE